MPEVKAPDREVSFREKFVWTAVVLIIFLIMSHMPLYGVDRTVGTDYLWAMRVILASTRGTLMELGIGPIVTAGLVMQLLSGSKIIDVDFGNPEDRALFTGGQKVIALFMTAFQAIAYIGGTWFVTALGNVPLNNKLATAKPGDHESSEVWEHYLDRWTKLNTQRTGAALLAAVLFSLGLIYA